MITDCLLHIRILRHTHLRFHAQGSVGYCPETRFVDQLPGHPANAIGLVFDPDKGFLELVYEVDLATGHLAQLLTLHAQAAVFHGHVTVIRFITAHLVFTGDQAVQVSKFLFRGFKLAHDQFLEFRQFCITVSHGGSGLFVGRLV